MSDTKRYTMTYFIMKLRETGQKHPIFVILSIAFIFRLFVAILLPDSGDFNIRERFLYFKMPIAWIDESTEYLSSQTYDEPQGISLFYLSLNYGENNLSIKRFPSSPYQRLTSFVTAPAPTANIGWVSSIIKIL